MATSNNLRCWEITKCENSRNCLARRHPEIKCWDHASQLDDYRRAFDVCSDCLVYLLNGTGAELSDPEVKDILAKRGLYSLVATA